MLDKDKFYGRVALSEGDQEKIFEVASMGKTYVEIGTLFGASACIAGLAGCDVYCIDPLDGYNVRGMPDPHDDHKAIPSPRIVIRNWINQGLDLGRLHIYARHHPPWPREINHHFDIGLIDGDHFTANCWLDFSGMSLRVQKYVMFHDILYDTVMPIWEAACKLDMWEEYKCETEKASSLGVLKRL